MTPTTQRGSNAFVATGFAIALAMFGCDSSSPSRTNGINNAKPDGGGSAPETGTGDTPLGGGGGIQGGGGGGKTAGGGSSGSTASGTEGGYGGVLGGSAGTISPAGRGGAAGVVGGSGGTTVEGGTGGLTGPGGVRGSGGTMYVPNQDGGSRSVLDGGLMPLCPSRFVGGFSGPCSALPAEGYCAMKDRPYDVCTCGANDSVECPLFGCPTGNAEDLGCSADMHCYYERLGKLCNCSTDRESTGRFVCTEWPIRRQDAAPVDTGPKAHERTELCSENGTFSTCRDSVRPRDMMPIRVCGGCSIPVDAERLSCVLADGHTVCQCINDYWLCPQTTCPAIIHTHDLCDGSASECKNEEGSLCYCGPGLGPDGVIALRFNCYPDNTLRLPDAE